MDDAEVSITLEMVRSPEDHQSSCQEVEGALGLLTKVYHLIHLLSSA